MSRELLKNAKNNKNDEFYTQYTEIQKEINAYLDYNPNVFRGKTILLPCDDPEWSNFTKFFAQNFERFGLKKLISTSYAYDSKAVKGVYQLSLFESMSELFDARKTKKCGKLFILEKKNNQTKTNIENLEWQYLSGDGDFRSEEVKKLRDEADIIITNPPFSLFREFVSWIMEKEKLFIIMGNKNAITYKEIFPCLKDNKIWIGSSSLNGGRWMIMPEGIEIKSNTTKTNEYGQTLVNIAGVCWFTNIEHGKRHQPLRLMTYEDNIRYSKHEEIKIKGYVKYDNYNAIDIPYVDAIPSNCIELMGVPITFMDKYNPEQFEIIGLGNGTEFFTPTKTYINPIMHSNGKKSNGNAINRVLVYKTNENEKIYYTADNTNYPLFAPFARIIIRYRKEWLNNENSTKN